MKAPSTSLYECLFMIVCVNVSYCKALSFCLSCTSGLIVCLSLPSSFWCFSFRLCLLSVFSVCVFCLQGTAFGKPYPICCSWVFSPAERHICAGNLNNYTESPKNKKCSFHVILVGLSVYPKRYFFECLLLLRVILYLDLTALALVFCASGYYLGHFCYIQHIFAMPGPVRPWQQFHRHFVCMIIIIIILW